MPCCPTAVMQSTQLGPNLCNGRLSTRYARHACRGLVQSQPLAVAATSVTTAADLHPGVSPHHQQPAAPIGALQQGTTYNLTTTSSSCSSRHGSSSSSTSSSRRALLLAGPACCGLPQLLQPQPADASIIDEDLAQAVYASAAPSVVSVADYKVVNGNEVPEGIGTGFVWDSYGHVVTNYHCVSKFILDTTGKQGVKVGITDAAGATTSYPATIIGKDAMHDLAVLRIEAPQGALQPLAVGTSADLKVGQFLYALGHPYGLGKSLTVGVVSGLNRTIPAPTGTRIYGAIQTDASINAGNSGGPLVDSFGRLVGVNTATFTKAGTGRGSGVNFALPADLVRDIVPNLIMYGSIAPRGVRSG